MRTTAMPSPPPAVGRDLLRVQPIDEDRFSGRCHVGAPRRAFGGQVSALALAAAACCVSPELGVHSMHGYFLDAARVDEPVSYRVERLRDSRSYATRRVTGTQGARAVITLTASFKTPEATGDRQQRMPAVPLPEQLPDPNPLWQATQPEEFERSVYRHAVEMRFVPGDALGPAGQHDAPAHAQWVRLAAPLDDSQHVHAAALVYASDIALAAAAAITEEQPRWLRTGPPRVFTTSLDHSVWFQRPFRADDWLLFSLRNPSLRDGRGLAVGEVWSRDGNLVAVAAQEIVIRPHP